MGSKGSKPRKPNHSQHLPKVGTATENARLQAEERRAIGEVMGFGDGTAARIVGVVAVAVVALALVAWILWF